MENPQEITTSDHLFPVCLQLFCGRPVFRDAKLTSEIHFL